jgi:DNA-directed RNA polymerase sigma subunit (sigma70/sigma32)
MSELDDDSFAFYGALDDLEQALVENVARANRMRERIAELREARSSGRPLRELVPAQEPPIIVRLLSESAQALDEYGSRVRRLEARVLHREGMTMEQIAELFGVSRQRVSALLRP